MGTQFWWIFDILTAFIAVYSIYSCARHGLAKVFFICIGYLAATVFSSLLGLATGRVLYEELGRDNDIQLIEEANRKADFPKAFSEWVTAQEYGFTVEESVVSSYLSTQDTEQFDVRFYNYLNERNGLDTPVEPFESFQEDLLEVFVQTYTKALEEGNLPQYAQNSFQERMAEDPSLMGKMLTVFYDPNNSETAIAEYVESTFTAQPAAEVMRILAYMIFFAIIMVVALVLMQATRNNLIFNFTVRTDHILGGMIGVLQVVAILFLFTLAVRLLVLLGGGDLLCFNDETIAHSKVFVYLYQYIRKLI